MLVALCLLGVSSAAGLPRAGSLDRSFGSGGFVPHSPGNPYPASNGITVQPDGKIVVAGGSSLARYLPNGSPDPSFGTGGLVKITAGDSVGAVALQPDGKIVVAGSRFVSEAECCGLSSEFMVARYKPNGSLDTSFGEHGVATTDVSASSPYVETSEFASALAILPSGQIVAGGTVFDAEDIGNYSWFALARYTSDGALDPTFNPTGKCKWGSNGCWVGVVETVFVAGDRLDGIVVLPSGEIVATGGAYGSRDTSGDYIVLARYNRDGSLDRSFGRDGEVMTPADLAYGGPPALQGGKIVVGAGRVFSRASGYGLLPELARFNANGSRDRTFGTSGFAKIGARIGTGSYSAVAAQADGKILAATTHSVVRFTRNGRLDTSFGAGGIVHLGSPASSLALQPDGRILVGGLSGSWSLARLIGWRNSCVVPHVSGETIAEATAALRKSHCTRGIVGWYRTSSAPRGRVIYTVPARGAHRPPGTAVELVVSEGN